MRKIGALLLGLCMVISLTACDSSDRKQISVAEAGYTCKADISYGDLRASALLEVMGGGLFSVEITEPSLLNGLRFSFDGASMTVSFGELTGGTLFTEEYGGFAELLNGVFMKLTTGQPLATKEGEDYVLSGVSDGHPFTVKINEQGFPTEIFLPDADCSAILTDWNYRA